MKVEIIRNYELVKGIWQMDITGNFPYDKVEPGQFIHIRVGEGYDHLLRRPISIAEVDPEKSLLTVVYKIVGEGTKWLALQRAGAALDILGPIGNGFITQKSRRSLVVGGGIGTPPLYELTKQLVGKSEQVDVFLGFRTSAEVFWLERFASLADVRVFTEDGQRGSRGFVTQGIISQLSEDENTWDNIYACGPVAMLRAVKEIIQNMKIGGGASLEERMACGVGACHGCTCKTAGQVSKRICVDGPVIPWQEVAL